jgi:hypothetical protein
MSKIKEVRASYAISAFAGIEISFDGITDGAIFTRYNHGGMAAKWVKRPINEYQEDEHGNITSTFTLYGITYNLNDFIRS